MTKQKARQLLLSLTQKKYLYFTKRGNKAIKTALKIAKQKQYNTILLQDQGGWLTYPQFAKELKLAITYLKTNYGILNPNDLKQHKDTILLINSMPAYAAYNDMQSIYTICKQNNIFLINDMCGSIGSNLIQGDIIIGSFGKAKPLCLGTGGFIATNEELDVRDEELDYTKLTMLIQTLNKRKQHMLQKANELKTLFSDKDIVHKNQMGFNVVIKYQTQEEKETLINKALPIEHTLCPRYIRINDKAISFEVKRLFK